ncbi:hypothetical protein HAX54_009914 [Datura stramonium]|uniref:Uncharacterized protein n=1 Tax=Datura stramonium TaxID=4076 RepID=A0ABS8RWF7_DATST|nr:hypothetical protein [Datura stramonium]
MEELNETWGENIKEEDGAGDKLVFAKFGYIHFPRLTQISNEWYLIIQKLEQQKELVNRVVVQWKKPPMGWYKSNVHKRWHGVLSCEQHVSFDYRDRFSSNGADIRRKMGYTMKYSKGSTMEFNQYENLPTREKTRLQQDKRQLPHIIIKLTKEQIGGRLEEAGPTLQ